MGLVVLLVPLLWLWFWLFSRAQAIAGAAAPAAWEAPKEVGLKPGPPSFVYDRASKKLLHRGPVDARLKDDLAKLVVQERPKKEEPTQKEIIVLQPGDRAAGDYWQALDEMAFKSNADDGSFTRLLLVLGGFSGVLGVHLRSLINFVGIACFSNRLDWVRWWPWYVVRPALGFLLGLVAVLFTKAELMRPEGTSPTGVTWWLGLAILAGFGAQEFSDKLRLLSQTIFGKSSSS